MLYHSNFIPPSYEANSFYVYIFLVIDPILITFCINNNKIIHLPFYSLKKAHILKSISMYLFVFLCCDEPILHVLFFNSEQSEYVMK